MNVESNRFEPLTSGTENQLKELEKELERRLQLVRPNGQPVPSHWPIFSVGEELALKNYTFKVAYIGETSILLEPVGPFIIGEGK